jgi:hypothetical protein
MDWKKCHSGEISVVTKVPQHMFYKLIPTEMHFKLGMHTLQTVHPAIDNFESLNLYSVPVSNGAVYEVNCIVVIAKAL